MMTKDSLFISHSGDSTPLADFFHEWIEFIIPTISTWVSSDPKCLSQGLNYPQSILNAAGNSKACFSILTEKNKNRHWINFEAGLFKGQELPIYALLCGNLSYKKLSNDNHPLSSLGMNYTLPTYESLESFFISLNNTFDNKIPEKVLKKNFKDNWSSFENKYSELFNEQTSKINNIIAGLTD